MPPLRTGRTEAPAPSELRTNRPPNLCLPAKTKPLTIPPPPKVEHVHEDDPVPEPTLWVVPVLLVGM
eukprot:5983481-Alexandrium_andersonii.AAC.1